MYVMSPMSNQASHPFTYRPNNKNNTQKRNESVILYMSMCNAIPPTFHFI